MMARGGTELYELILLTHNFRTPVVCWAFFWPPHLYIDNSQESMIAIIAH